MAAPTNPRAAAHPVAITAPYFAVRDGTGIGTKGATLHRYQETEFIPRFLTDLAAGRLADPARADWWREDRFSGHDNHLVLRLPVHRTFYLVACEVVCDRPGRPALDPARIRSAGFVIRRVGGARERLGSRLEGRRRTRAARLTVLKERLLGRESETARKVVAEEQEALARLTAGNGAELAWVVEDGEPVGWELALPGGRDPDLGRRVGRTGALRPGPTPPAYSGEETHPLHPATARDGAGRLHTLLYGFLPLGGQALFRGAPSSGPFTDQAEQRTLAAEQERLTWPFGYRGRADRTWRAADARQVDAGVPGAGFFALLEVLVSRYHLGEVQGEGGRGRVDPLNADLAEAARGLAFIDEAVRPKAVRTKGGGQASSSGAQHDGPFDLVDAAYPTRFTLWDYLESCFAAGEDNPLPVWLANERRRIDAAGGLDVADPASRLPARPEDGGGDLALTLLIEPEDAQEWRNRLGQRLIDQARRTGAEFPIPKFRQEPDDLYQLVPFVRALDDAGCERITWAAPAVRSEPFRVAAPFDPDASRPVLIQMPSLADLKRGLAKGAAMLVPPDTQQLFEALKLDKGVSPDLVPGPPPEGAGLGVQWICSFSLPVITLVAMILLMIMIVLLNLVFFWLPWVRICLPFPKLK
jgi:hypothetical protein